MLTSEAIRTEVFHAGEDLVEFVARALERGSKGEAADEIVVAVTSKIVSLAEGRVLPRRGGRDEKRALIESEADRVLGEAPYGVRLTIKHGILIPSAGIDESNAEGGGFILFPKDPYASAERLGRGLRSRLGSTRLGVILTDSHTQALRRGVTGIGLSHWGFRATKDQVGRKDLFGREMKTTHVNALDALAVAAVYVMGETDERCPVAVLRGTGVTFTDSTSAEEIRIPLEQDLYGALLFPRDPARQ